MNIKLKGKLINQENVWDIYDKGILSLKQHRTHHQKNMQMEIQRNKDKNELKRSNKHMERCLAPLVIK